MKQMYKGVCCIFIVVVSLSLQHPTLGSTIIVGDDSEDTQELANILSADGDDSIIYNAETFSKLEAIDGDLLVVCDGSKFPAETKLKGMIDEYLAKGGDIIVLNGPLWHENEIRGRCDKSTVPDKAFQREMDHVIFDFTSVNLADWSRGSSGLNNPVICEIVDIDGPHFPKALSVNISGLTNWESYISPIIEAPFPDECELLVLYAKGDERTVELAIELIEENGTRWVVTIPVRQKWRKYVLDPKTDFSLWPNRLDRTRTPDLKKIQGIAFQMSMSHTASFGGGKHSYQIGPIGTVKRNPKNAATVFSVFESPIYETLCPEYKFFRSHEVSSIVPAFDQQVITGLTFPDTDIVFSPHVRPSVIGFDKQVDTRWVPLLTVQNEQGQWRGHPATMLIHADGKYKNGAWVSFGINDKQWYRDKNTLAAVKQVAEKIHKGVFLLDAGTDVFTCFEGQELKLGANVINISGQGCHSLKIQATVSTPEDGRIIEEAAWGFELSAGQKDRYVKTFKLPLGQEKKFNIKVELFHEGKVIDIAEHELHIWQSKKQKNFIQNKNGNFYLDGQRWRANGINYMPSSGSARDEFEYFGWYLQDGAYCPKVTKRDINNLLAMNINAISIWMHYKDVGSGALLDILRMADEAGLKVNLALREADPMQSELEELLKILRYYKIPEHDCIFALDIRWEPSFGGYGQRKKWDPQWCAWIESHYGSISQGAVDWEFELPKDGQNNITSPSDYQMSNNGPWNAMVAAYRRFVDTLLYEKYSQAIRMIRTIDKNHMISFRMLDAGNPTFASEWLMQYDWAFLAGAVDIIEPEAYGRLGEWEQVRPGLFVGNYASWAASSKPLIWAEAGVSSWSKGKNILDIDQSQHKANFFGDIYRMIFESDADGIFFWYYPGGYRTDEISDYGVINPDGTDRPVTKVIRENAKKLIDSAKLEPKTVEKWFIFDRDMYAEGMPGFYSQIREEYWQTIENGLKVGLRTEATDTDSSNCPLIAIGNKPAKFNRQKYLEGFYNGIQIKNSDGHLIAEVKQGDTVESSGQYSLRATIELTNLCEPTWLSPIKHEKDGVVYLVVRVNMKEYLTPIPCDLQRFDSVILKDVILLDKPVDGPEEISITLRAKNRCDFGPVFKFTIIP